MLEIPLEDDLSNASIATCKEGPDADWFAPPPTALVGPALFASTFSPHIYDPVMHEHYNEDVLDYEHQVT